MPIKLCLYFTTLGLLAGIGVVRWRSLAGLDRLVMILMWLTFASELLAWGSAVKWHNNMPVYHVFSAIQFLAWSIYFNFSVSLLRKRKIGLLVGVAGVACSVLNALFLQPVTTINSYFLLLEGTLICIYCLLSMREMLLMEEALPHHYVQFWLSGLSLLFWSSVFTGWGLYELLKTDCIVLLFFDTILAVANYVFYLGVAATLLFYNRLIPTTRV